MKYLITGAILGAIFLHLILGFALWQFPIDYESLGALNRFFVAVLTIVLAFLGVVIGGVVKEGRKDASK